MSHPATALLKSDHRVIEGVLNSLERIVQEIGNGAAVPIERINDILLFSQVFVDRCHHGKEEVCLFPCVEKKGIPKEGGPIGVMLLEHQIGREMVVKILEALRTFDKDQKNAEELARMCAEYAAHLRQHIFKEENILFRMSEGVMDYDDHRTSVDCYERTEEERVGAAKHEEMVRLSAKIASEE